MELSISKKDFLRGLARTHAVADRKSSMPILSNVLLSADDSGVLRFAATDLYLAVSASAEADVKRAGTVALSARTLFDIVKNLPEGEVKLGLDKHNAVLLRSGKIKFRIPGMPGEDFPPLPSAGEGGFADIDASLLSQLIALTQYSMSSDDTRPHLAGTLFELDGRAVRMVTTDGHRLSKAEVPYEAPTRFSILVPSKGIAELKRLLEDAKSEKRPVSSDKGPEKNDEKAELTPAGPAKVGVATVGGNAFFRGQDVQLSVKLADEQFPPYAKVIPQSHSRRVIAARDLLVDSLRRISLVASDKSGGVRLALEPGKLEIVSENPDVGEGSEELDVDFAGEKVAIGFNARYLLEALQAMTDDEVVIELGGELDPGVIKPVHDGRFVGVIMPMRI
ncbi:MAG TPA: DNA polymerase III subunit beta [Polyangiales bacterium]|nr:DNA polymerase III subunit beta [Polyangiales bacterium]